jgi:hypothetical protein
MLYDIKVANDELRNIQSMINVHGNVDDFEAIEQIVELMGGIQKRFEERVAKEWEEEHGEPYFDED